MKCVAEECDREAVRRDLCWKHYMRKRRTGTTVIAPIIKVKCSVEDCGAMATTNTEFCLKHHKQKWYLNSIGRTELIERTSQGYWIHAISGYIMIKVEGKLVYEHRYLAEKALGKPLPPEAIVHHMGEPHDNVGPFKLVICPDQEYHMLIHKRMRDLGYENNQDA